MKTDSTLNSTSEKDTIILVISSWERLNLPDSIIQLSEKNRTEHSSIPPNHYKDTCSFALSYAEFGKMLIKTPGNFASCNFTDPGNPNDPINYWWYTTRSKFTQA